MGQFPVLEIVAVNFIFHQRLPVCFFPGHLKKTKCIFMKSPKKRHKNLSVGVEEIIDILSWLSKVFQKSTFNNFCSH